LKKRSGSGIRIISISLILCLIIPAFRQTPSGAMLTDPDIEYTFGEEEADPAQEEFFGEEEADPAQEEFFREEDGTTPPDAIFEEEDGTTPPDGIFEEEGETASPDSSPEPENGTVSLEGSFVEDGETVSSDGFSAGEEAPAPDGSFEEGEVLPPLEYRVTYEANGGGYFLTEVGAAPEDIEQPLPETTEGVGQPLPETAEPAPETTEPLEEGGETAWLTPAPDKAETEPELPGNAAETEVPAGEAEQLFGQVAGEAFAEVAEEPFDEAAGDHSDEGEEGVSGGPEELFSGETENSLPDLAGLTSFEEKALSGQAVQDAQDDPDTQPEQETAEARENQDMQDFPQAFSDYTEAVPEGTRLFNSRPENLIPYEGYEFLGWSLEHEGGSLLPEEGYEVREDLTVYAVWEYRAEDAGTEVNEGELSDKTEESAGDMTEEADGGSDAESVSGEEDEESAAETIFLEEPAGESVAEDPVNAGADQASSSAGSSTQQAAGQAGTGSSAQVSTKLIGSRLVVPGYRKISKAKVTLSATRYVYSGKARKPRVTVTYGQVKLKQGTDFAVSYSNNIRPGKATVKITGRGTYRGTITRYFTITRAPQKLTLKAPVRMAARKKYRMKAGGARGTKKYSFKSSNTGVISVTAAGVIFARKVGTAKITVSTAASKYYAAGKRTVTVRVVPGATSRFTAHNKTRGFLLKWNRVAGANGYYIYRDGKRVKTITKGTTVFWSDTAADVNGRRYNYRIVAKAATGASTASRSFKAYRAISTVAASSTSRIRYCFEQSMVPSTLEKCRKNDIAVIDLDGISTSVIRTAKSRGVQIYGYLNAGAMEKQRSYYDDYKNLRLAEYDGWPGEYWMDVTKSAWLQHLMKEARTMKARGATGVYLDNTDIYYMVRSGFENDDADLFRTPPSAASTYRALRLLVKSIDQKVGLTVMPNGGDHFVRKFVADCPGIIRIVNQEGVLYEDFEPQSTSATRYLTKYLDWCREKGIYVRGIEYTKSDSQAERARDYYRRHGWLSLYISRHTDLEGD